MGQTRSFSKIIARSGLLRGTVTSLDHADGGMHFIAWLRGDLGDAEIVERLRWKGIGPASLSRCSLNVSGYNGLLIGYTNVAKESAASATERMLGAMRRIR